MRAPNTARALVGIVGDFKPSNATHQATNQALAHADLDFEWVPTDEVMPRQPQARLAAYAGRAWWAMLCLGLHLLTPSLTPAADVGLMSVGVRGGLTGQTVIGEREIESFQQYDITATLGLPWSWYSESGWGVGTRLMVSAGALTGAGETGFVGTLVPVIALGPQNSQFSLDLGAGGALLTRHEFGNQNFGGPFQVVLTFGLRVPVYRGIGMGYRVQHLSDATLYGSKTRGADLHMFELIYSFP